MIELEKYNFQFKNLDDYFLFRYFKSFERLESFLTEGIHLARADSFSDNLECISKKEMIEVNKFKYFKELYLEHNPELTKEDLDEFKNQFRDNLRDVARTLKVNQQKYFISCWYVSDNNLEDELMWRSYGRRMNEKEAKDGFMVKISLKDFMQNFARLDTERNSFDKLILGPVRYFDFSKSENIMEVKYAGFRKHASFSSEREFRVVFKKKVEVDGRIYIVPPTSFYMDTIIYSHPNISDQEFLMAKEELAKFNKVLNMSELQMWYKLKLI